MEKTTTNLCVHPIVKQAVGEALKQLGVPMATAVDMFLRQIDLTGSIPFVIALPKAPDGVSVDKMTASGFVALFRWGWIMEAGKGTGYQYRAYAVQEAARMKKYKVKAAGLS